MPRLSLAQIGWPMATSVTVSRSSPVARSRMRRSNRSDPLSSTSVAASRPSGLTASAPRRKYSFPSASTGSSKTICSEPPAAGRRYQVRYCAPGLNAHQYTQSPSRTRDRRFVLLDAALHLLEQGLDELGMRLHRRFEIGVLGLEIGQHRLVLDLRIGRILQPGIGILDRIAVAFVAIRARLGAGRGWEVVRHEAFRVVARSCRAQENG